MKKFSIKLCMAVLLMGINGTLQAITPFIFSHDDIFFYQAPSFHGTHGFYDQRDVTTLEVRYTNGSARRGEGRDGHKTPILDIYGTHNLRFLIDGIPSTNVSSTVTPFFDALKAADTDELLGEVSFTSKFEVDDARISLRHAVTPHIFFEADLPIKRLKTRDITLVDLSPDLSSSNPDAAAAWTDLKDNLDTILNAFGLKSLCCAFDNKVRAGDLRVLGGWSNQFDLQSRGFIHALLSGRIGIHLPTGDTLDTKHAFAIPIGYNGHIGIPVRVDAALVTSQGITLGGHMGATFFYDKRVITPVRTSDRQTGWLRLIKQRLGEKMGTTFFAGAYGMVDLPGKGLSLLAGYSFNVQGSRTLSVVKGCELEDCIVNDDRRLEGWDAHVAHFGLSYDFRSLSLFAQRCWAPYLNFFINYQFCGKTSFSNDTGGGTMGLDVAWRW